MGRKRKQVEFPKEIPGAPRWYMPEWLKYTGRTQSDIVEATGLSLGYVSDLVNGKERYNQDVLWAFAWVLKCPPGAIVDVNPLSDDGALVAQLLIRRYKPKAA